MFWMCFENWYETISVRVHVPFTNKINFYFWMKVSFFCCCWKRSNFVFHSLKFNKLVFLWTSDSSCPQITRNKQFESTHRKNNTLPIIICHLILGVFFFKQKIQWEEQKNIKIEFDFGWILMGVHSSPTVEQNWDGTVKLLFSIKNSLYQHNDRAINNELTECIVCGNSMCAHKQRKIVVRKREQTLFRWQH